MRVFFWGAEMYLFRFEILYKERYSRLRAEMKIDECVLKTRR